MAKKEIIQKNITNNINIIRKIENSETLTNEEMILLKQYSGQNSHPFSKDLNTEYYTPDIISKFIIDILELNNITDKKSVCDISCGIGNMFKFIENNNLKLFGYEIDFISSKICSILYPNSIIKNCDTLKEIHNIDKHDYIIGNPPFGGKYIYKFPWDTKDKKYSLDTIFLYHSINLCKENGYIGLVVPDGLLSNSGSKNIREYIFTECELIAVISLPVETFMFSGISGTGAKTSVIILKKLNNKDYKINDNGLKLYKNHRDIFMAVVDSGGLGWDNKGKETKKNDLDIILKCFMEGVKNE